MTTPYPHLLSPIRIGPRTIPNRAIMGSMHLGLEERADGFERMAAFYAERVRGGTRLIVTGGISPNAAGRIGVNGAVLNDETAQAPSGLDGHRRITEAVHAEGGLVLLQLLHSGRYATHPDLVAPSPLRAPINRFSPRELTDADIRRTIADYGRAAEIARLAGYDGVEVMGSEGYLINEFLAPATNLRDDAWGGDADRRMAFALATTEAVRRGVGDSGILSYRISVADLVPDGSTLDEALTLAAGLEARGVDLFVTGIGWHEARVPTIATSVPRAAWTGFTRRLRAAVRVPVAATNRINTPETAEAVIADGDADLVALARPLLADAAFMQKARERAPERVNTCIACNQACLDQALAGSVTSCLVNPRACNETLLVLAPTRRRRRVAVIGAGPAGLAAATAAAERGHRVTLFEARGHLGGQFDLARRIPGKEEFAETLRYFAVELERLGVELRLGASATAAGLGAEGFETAILATGVKPRRPDLPGVDLPIVADYAQILRGERTAGDRVAVLGAGGIGFDVTEFLTQDGPSAALDPVEFRRLWGVAEADGIPGSVVAPRAERSRRRITMLQRKETKAGAGLGLTTGWIHRAEIARRGVETLVGVAYERITPEGVLVVVDDERRLIAADTVVLCTGQESVEELGGELAGLGIAAHVVGGALLAGELDAKRAIREGTEAAAAL